MNKYADLIAEIAYQYYIENLNQSQISKMYNIGRSTISRIIKQAREDGIVEIKINSINPEIITMQNFLKEKYNIKHAVINTVDKDDNNFIKNKKMYQSAAKYLSRVLEDEQNIGLSWGETIAQTVQNMTQKTLPNTNFIPLVGGPSNANINYHVNTIIYEMVAKTNGNPYFINAAVIQENKQTRDGIIYSQYFKEISQFWAQLDVAIVGIGGILSTKTSQWRDLLSADDFDLLRLEGAIGDVCCRFIDRKGHLVHSSLNDRTIGIGLKDLKAIPVRIGIARGKPKASAIKALLNQNLLTHLITDLETAKLLS